MASPEPPFRSELGRGGLHESHGGSTGRSRPFCIRNLTSGPYVVADHKFGGPWTLVKLDLLEKYLQFFGTALKDQPKPDSRFRRCYIDAFAGTGKCTIRISKRAHATVRGSAEIALATEPAFDVLHLIDLDPSHAEDLRLLASSTAPRDVRVYQEDCNAALRGIIESTEWKGTRGVAFLDPYGMSLRWETLKAVADTKALDAWYLFPLSGVFRQAAKDFDRILPENAEAIDRILGTDEWRERFYLTDGQTALLGEDQATRRYRAANPRDIAAYVHERLCSIFRGWVSPPIILPESGAPLFALFFVVSNPGPKAVELSRRGAGHLFEMLKKKRIGRRNLTSTSDESTLTLF